MNLRFDDEVQLGLDYFQASKARSFQLATTYHAQWSGHSPGSNSLDTITCLLGKGHHCDAHFFNDFVAEPDVVLC